MVSRTLLKWWILMFVAGLSSALPFDDIDKEVDDQMMMKIIRAAVNQTKGDTLNLPSNSTSIRENITDTFSCEDLPYGYYADVDNDCQVFHVCLPSLTPSGRNATYRWSFICPAETVFNQEVLVCTRPRDAIDCSDSPMYYDKNLDIGKVCNDTTNDKPDSDKTDADKTEADKTEADKTEADKTDADKTDADKTEADKTDADKTDADKTDPDKTDVDKTDSDKTDNNNNINKEEIYINKDVTESNKYVKVLKPSTRRRGNKRPSHKRKHNIVANSLVDQRKTVTIKDAVTQTVQEPIIKNVEADFIDTNLNQNDIKEADQNIDDERMENERISAERSLKIKPKIIKKRGLFRFKADAI